MKKWTCAASLLLVVVACDNPLTTPSGPRPTKVAVPEAGPMSTQGPVAGPLSSSSPQAGAMSTGFPQMEQGSGNAASIASAGTFPGWTAHARQFEPTLGGAAAAVAPAVRLLWQNTATGDRSIWIMNGTAWDGSSYALLPNVAGTWSMAASGDFNADGNSDIVWQNTASGQRSIWFMNNTTWNGAFTALPTVAVAWSIAGAGDFNADGKPDLVWQNTTTGDRSIWFMNGSAWDGTSFALLPNVAAAWRIAAVADFNADNKPDLVWQNITTGQRSIWFMNGGTWTGTYSLLPTVAAEWRIVGAADFDGDSKPDLVWQNLTTGQRSIWIMNGSTWGGSYATLPTISTAWSIAGTLAPPTAASGPDLLVDALTAAATGTIGGTISVSATVRNQGTAATGAFRLGFYYSTDATITTADTFSGSACAYGSGLAAGTTSDCTGSIAVPSTLAPGTYYVGAIADDQAQVSESNESNNARASSTTTVLSGGGTLNLLIDGMYVTQATQTYAGGVPLVTGRPALLRVFVKANQTNTATPTVRVRLYQNGTLLSTSTINAPSASVPTAITEGVLASSWNLSIAGATIQSGLTILADVDPTNAIAETSETDNSFPTSGTPKTFDVRTVSTFNVMLVPVLQTPNGLQGDVTEANKATYLDFTKRVYPLATYDAAVHAAYSYGSALSSGYDITWTTLLSEMVALRLIEGNSRHYYGVIRPAYSYGGTGYGNIGGYGALGVDWTDAITGSNTTYRSMTAAHEWGHNFNRKHVDCGGPDPSSVDASYPYATNSIGQYGYDLSNGQLRAPASFADLMSYCQPLFVSDYTYKGVLDYRATLGEPPVLPPQRSLLVWGHIGPSGVVLEPSFEIDAPPSFPTRAGPYSLQATDDAGHEIFNLSFDGDAIDHQPGERLFVFVVPLAATGPTPATLRLIANGREAILRSSVATSTPGNITAALASVRLSPANGSLFRLQWDAASFPMALVRDPATGQVLSFARGGQIDVAMPGRDLDVIFSNGVTSVRRLITIASR